MTREQIKKTIRTIPDFPEPGVLFRDITPVLESPTVLRSVIQIFLERYRPQQLTHIGGMDARGFTFGSILAYELQLPFVLFRKGGKLPGAVASESYQTEYGTAQLEIHQDTLTGQDHILLLDDLIATGGTLIAAANLARKAGATVVEVAALVDLPELGGSQKLREHGVEVFSIVDFSLSER